jgi:hypothetical protein
MNLIPLIDWTKTGAHAAAWRLRRRDAVSHLPSYFKKKVRFLTRNTRQLDVVIIFLKALSISSRAPFSLVEKGI